ncbi:2-succinyl-6-hydroxy-2,4-cyclohexadiene-1-carboxylate synthase [Coleofasciculus sp. FACHB-1120]|uniref:2-succinyl-6-hydroxy-2, 4-cyclohexadiene-1-carboxylate synthase n=1 Tax=Coleofasciculus sp. FACHB-1120 TaxID=2692783 RepID=UPI001682D886|nr:2-succinyl-6-hydroxy-2,4-cyclohexadiene-1-carboxylate synthase [Coleofasciculus sp. FACHB-1120]MBD2742691.1 2-succinyl-6-hydroxy-2,4-cyclohexadiene-1-carboxylate synthase [Coleofasciculus sp. FACHB-1120]
MTFDNYQFHYSLSGSTDKPIILFLHGFMGDCNEFNQVISFLSNQFCCLAIDLPGHGQTKVMGGDECYKMANTAHALLNLLEQLSIEKCFLVGYSMGGRLALYLTLHFPERFPKVVLESASPGLETEEERWKRIQRDLELSQELVKINFSEFLTNWYNQPLFVSLKKNPKFEQMIESRLRNNPCELAKSLRNFSTGCQPSLWEAIAQNQTPLLLLVGEYDNKFRIINLEMARLCAAAKVNLISNCGHNIHMENPRVFFDKVRQFLAKPVPG